MKNGRDTVGQRDSRDCGPSVTSGSCTSCLRSTVPPMSLDFRSRCTGSHSSSVTFLFSGSRPGSSLCPTSVLDPGSDLTRHYEPDPSSGSVVCRPDRDPSRDREGCLRRSVYCGWSVHLPETETAHSTGGMRVDDSFPSSRQKLNFSTSRPFCLDRVGVRIVHTVKPVRPGGEGVVVTPTIPLLTTLRACEEHVVPERFLKDKELINEESCRNPPHPQ